MCLNVGESSLLSFALRKKRNIKDSFYRIRSIVYLVAGLFFIPCFLGESLHAQSPFSHLTTPVNFEALTREDGLASEKVISVAQDHQGFLWIGTQEGLHRYDGFDLMTYQHNDTIPGSLSNNTIEELYVDKNGTLWVGTWNGLNRYDWESNSFHTYYPNREDSSSISDVNIQEIMEDAAGQLWVGTGAGGVCRYDPERDAFVSYQHDANNPSGLSSNVTPVLYVDRAGTLWVGGGSPWDHLSNHGGLNRYDPERDVFISYTVHSNLPNGLLSNKISALFEDAAGNFWVATWGGGLQLFDRTAEKFYTPSSAEADKWPLWSYWHTEKGLPGTIKTIHESRSGLLWIGYFSGGLDWYDPNTVEVPNYSSESSPESGLLGDIVWKIFEDRQGILWLCTWKGLNKINPKSRPFEIIGASAGGRPGLKDAHVEGILLDSENQLWMGSWAGLEWYDPATGRFQLFKPGRGSKQSDISEMILSLFEDSQKNLWLGTVSNGLTQFDKSTKKFTYVTIAEPYEDWEIVVTSLVEDEQGTIWVGSSYGVFKLEKGQTELIPVFDFENYPEHKLSIYVLKADQKGRIWIGSSGGLDVYDPANGSTTSILEGYTVSEVLVEDAQTVWVGTESGELLKYDVVSQAFTSFSPENGLPGEMIRALIIDDENRLWMSTNQGIAWLDKENNLIRPFSDQPGPYSKEAYPASVAKGRNGNLLFGTSNGVFVFDPKSIQVDRTPAIPFVTGLKIFDEDQVLPLADSESPYQAEIKLPHDQNDLTFAYTGLHFVRPAANTFRYLLENYEDKWREVGKQRVAIYPNVPPGKYVFRVQSANPDGIWSTEEASIQVIIHPPWWRTTIAFFIYGLLAILGFILLDRFQKNRLLSQEREKASMQKAQLRAEVAETQARQLRELDEAKARLYTNITHEFRTPLTVIQGMADNIRGHQHERSLIQRNSKNLLQLINQLLDLSKLEANAMQLDLMQGDIIAYLQYLTESFYSMAQEKEIRLLFYPELPELLMDYDEKHVQQIVYNLLSNALKFTTRTGKVVLHASQISKAGQKPFLQLKVQDSGIGIPEDQLPKIFDRFYQADGSSTRKRGGTGIGLALTKKLVDLMGGTITVESAIGKGTMFTILLPITNQATLIEKETILRKPKEVLPNTSTERAKLPGLLPEKDKPVLLLIEDNADIVVYITDLLEQDYAILHAQDGKEGIDMALDAIPDIIISDVMMPEVDGYEVCHTLKNDERSSHIPIILLTAKSTQEDKVKGLEVGADAYLVKPFHKEELFVRLEKLVALRKTLQASYTGESSLSQKIVNKQAPTLNDQFLQKLYEVVADKMDDPNLGVVHLCRAAKLSNTQVNRKLKALTSRTPSQFIRVIRLERAMELLKTTDLNVSEIAYDVGFNDPNYFSRTFLEEFGLSPSEIRK